MASARTLQDITDERVVPVDYLGVLILLFLLLVLDRLFYSLGLHLGKVQPYIPLWTVAYEEQRCASWKCSPFLLHLERGKRPSITAATCSLRLTSLESSKGFSSGSHG